MVRVRRLVVIVRVAARTGVRRIVVVAVVAIRAVHRRVRSVQGIIRIVDRETRRRPARGRRVAALAVRRDTQRHVVGVRGLGVIVRMATRTGVRRVVVIAVMASITGNALVRPR